MAGRGDSDAKGGVSSSLDLGTGTWRVTGEEGIQGRHGELLGLTFDRKHGPGRAGGAGGEMVPFAGDPSGVEGLEDIEAGSQGSASHGVLLRPRETIVVRDDGGHEVVWASRGGYSAGNGPDPSSAFYGSYKSYIYKVRYASAVERSLPKSPSEATATDPTSRFDHTYMRVFVPSFLPITDMEWLGVALCMEGGTETEGSVRLHEELAKPSLKVRLSYLASGQNHSGTPPSFYFRSGDPMIAAAFNYPGRGDVVAGYDLVAEGAADFMNDSPSNAEGQDYCGEMTCDATEAVVQVLLRIVEDLQQQWDEHPRTFGSLGSEGHRLVVASNSWGLNTASRWIANTEVDVHALVDWEGPTDAAEALGVTDAYNPYDDPVGPLDQDLTVEVFMKWAVPNQRGFLFWFRPPETSSFSTSLFSRYSSIFPEDWSSFISRLEHRQGVAVADMWRDRYQRSYPRIGSESLESQVDSFWSDRVALRWLPEVAARQTAYVRIQSRFDHVQPDHMYQRHAIKALNAAFEGCEQHVYYAGEVGDYWDDISLAKDATPDRMTSAFDIDRPFVDTGCGAWGDYVDFWPNLLSHMAWGTEVDLVRWTVQTSFFWRSGRSGTTIYPGRSFDMTDDRIDPTPPIPPKWL